MKWYHCDNCGQVQRFKSTCGSCGEEGEEVEIERDNFQLALPMVGVPLIVAGVMGYFARDFAYKVSGDSTAVCSTVMVLYLLGLVTVFMMSIAGFFIAKRRVREKVDEEVERMRKEKEYTWVEPGLRYKEEDMRESERPRGRREGSDEHRRGGRRGRRRRRDDDEYDEEPPRRRRGRRRGGRGRRRYRDYYEDENGDDSDEPKGSSDSRKRVSDDFDQLDDWLY